MKASEDDIVSAVENMSAADRIRVEKYARLRVNLLAKFAKGRTHEDLIQESMTRIFAGDRSWKKDNVDFLRFFIWVMKSVSNHWTKEKDAKVEILSWEENPVTIQPKRNNPVGAHHTADQLAKVEIADSIEALYEKLVDDDEAILVFDELRIGKKGPEIQSSLGLSAKEYDTIRKRLFRKLRK